LSTTIRERKTSQTNEDKESNKNTQNGKEFLNQTWTLSLTLLGHLFGDPEILGTAKEPT
jgi:hypothetical protein